MLSDDEPFINTYKLLFQQLHGQFIAIIDSSYAECILITCSTIVHTLLTATVVCWLVSVDHILSAIEQLLLTF